MPKQRTHFLFALRWHTTIGHALETKASSGSDLHDRVMYWSTNEGNWNQSGNGFGRQISILTATNTGRSHTRQLFNPHILVRPAEWRVRGAACPG